MLFDWCSMHSSSLAGKFVAFQNCEQTPAKSDAQTSGGSRGLRTLVKLVGDGLQLAVTSPSRRTNTAKFKAAFHIWIMDSLELDQSKVEVFVELINQRNAVSAGCVTTSVTCLMMHFLWVQVLDSTSNNCVH